jgi:hypothetical protein
VSDEDLLDRAADFSVGCLFCRPFGARVVIRVIHGFHLWLPSVGAARPGLFGLTEVSLPGCSGCGLLASLSTICNPMPTTQIHVGVADDAPHQQLLGFLFLARLPK